jgi:hypothetical protein
VSVRRQGTLLFYALRRGGALSPAWHYESTYLNSGSLCGVARQDPGFLDVHFTEPVGTSAEVDDSYNPLDLDAELPEGECWEDTSGLNG